LRLIDLCMTRYDAVTFSDVMNDDEKGQYYGRGLGVKSPW